MLPHHTSIRILSIICVIAIKVSVPNQTTWMSLVFSLGFGHYLLSIVYAKNQLVQSFRQLQSSVMMGLLLIAGGLLYYIDFSLVIFFGIHHVFNEVYLVNRSLVQSETRSFTFYRISSIVLNFFIYFVILRDTPGLDFINPDLLLGGLIISYGVFAYSLFGIRKYLKGGKLIDSFAFELTGMIFVVLSYFIYIGFVDIVFYHFVFWVFYPIQKFSSFGKLPLARYLFLTVACTVIFLILSPIGFFNYQDSGSIFYKQFFLWSYIHITSSFALSSAHPVWITRLFKPGYT